MRHQQTKLPGGCSERVDTTVALLRRKPFYSRARFISLFATTSLAFLPNSVAFAACMLVPSAGNDIFTCDSGDSGGSLTDIAGNNTLTFPAAGTGQVSGSVTFGAGTDRIEMQSGTITGGVNQGDGSDSFVIGGGTVTGNVQQGSGIDDFNMSGGQIGSLNQGDGLDTFTMSEGRIVDFFDDGDHAVMTGGRIGRVNMKLDDNVFDMSGGTIDKNLVTGFGNDTIILSNGTIGGNISVSGGTDSVTVTGGTVGGEIRMSVGTDTFTWDGGGIIYGAIDLGGDADTASLSNLTDANIGATPQITGGAGIDALTFNNVKTGDVARFDSWETIDLTNDSQLIFDQTLTLGDAGTNTGSLTVDSSSTIFGGQANGGIAAFTAGQFAEVVNAGRIDLTNGGDGATDTFTIAGNYTGEGGQIFLNTVLGDDTSASDKLVIDGGTASGTTGMNIINSGGTGDSTRQDGIMVVEAINNGTTDSGAFALNSRVAAGAYEYLLFKGGVSANTEDNWYLRSTLVTPPAGPPPEPAPAPDPVEPQAPPPQAEEPEIVPPPPASELPDTPLPSEGDGTTEPTDPTPPVDVSDPEPEPPPAPPPAEPAEPPPPPPAPPTTPAPVPGPTATPPTPGATPVIADEVPLYRIEVPTYSVVPPVAHHLALSTLGTFHERRGEQILLHGGGYLPATWGRIFGQSTEMGWSGTVAPSFDGNLFGFQAGQDLFGRETDNGHFDRFGFFIGHANIDGDVKGQALGWNDLAVGDIDLGGTSFGGYWTHIGPQGWYVDAVLMGTWFDGDASSNSGESIDIDGTGVTASLEGGYPIALTDRWTLEPQGQIIWQHLSLDDSADSFSSVSFDSDDAVTGRVGFRLQGNYQTGASLIQPYLKANLWHNFSADQTILFDGDPITTELGGTSLEFGGGIVANLNEKLSLFATADYTTDIDGEETEIFEGNLGLSIKW
ncbi:autotransporter family protein [Mesorhizobium robiniae]|uniref:autotransporter family protein n=1 Tax=Mesorhizobium robiniae TaxID=559315 RepID=UPI003398DA83